jgi:hypothetical protein
MSPSKSDHLIAICLTDPEAGHREKGNQRRVWFFEPAGNSDP